MKKAMILLVVMSWGMLFAQVQRKIVRIGCVDIQRIIDRVASDRLLRKILEDKKSDFLKQAEEMSREIQSLKDILAKEYNTLPKARIDAYEEQILLKQQQLKAFMEEKHLIVSKMDSEVSVRVLKNIYDYIKQVAEKYGYSMIIEKGTAVVYVEDELDITNEVLKLLEQELEPYKNFQ
jgi:outer membrane protein